MLNIVVWYTPGGGHRNYPNSTRHSIYDVLRSTVEKKQRNRWKRAFLLVTNRAALLHPPSSESKLLPKLDMLGGTPQNKTKCNLVYRHTRYIVLFIQLKHRTHLGQSLSLYIGTAYAILRSSEYCPFRYVWKIACEIRIVSHEIMLPMRYDRDTP